MNNHLPVRSSRCTTTGTETEQVGDLGWSDCPSLSGEEMNLAKRALASAVLIAGVGATSPSGIVHAGALEGGTCLAHRSFYDGSAGRNEVDVSITVNGTRLAGGTVRIESVTYRFSNPHWEATAPTSSGVWLPDKPRSLGNSNNINVTYPVSKYSSDTLAPNGTYDFVNFTVNTGTRVSVQAIPDLVGKPDPNCTVSVTV